MPLAQLISAQQLAERLQQPRLRILDCRFALEDPAYGRRSHAQSHIPGAQFADLEQDLSGPVIKGVTGRHPLPATTELVARLRSWGIDDDSQIVLYDDGPGAFAARAWWLLAWLGKRDDVFVLDGGFKAWSAANLPLDTRPVVTRSGNFSGTPDDDLIIEAQQLLAELTTLDQPLLDARALPRFNGEVEPIDPVAGHIPGAICAPFTDNLAADGRFLSPAQLRERFAELLQGQSDEVIAYCGSGVTACHNLFALSLAGYPLGRLYPGSWSEWITDSARPLA
ncbi:rhodanese domain-containing protein [Stutzerimonas stutzeri TS44]|nr:rhodanese domain-containing protein [Stutzerimonas stutzeri TS44]